MDKPCRHGCKTGSGMGQTGCRSVAKVGMSAVPQNAGMANGRLADAMARIARWPIRLPSGLRRNARVDITMFCRPGSSETIAPCRSRPDYAGRPFKAVRTGRNRLRDPAHRDSSWQRGRRRRAASGWSVPHGRRVLSLTQIRRRTKPRLASVQPPVTLMWRRMCGRCSSLNSWPQGLRAMAIWIASLSAARSPG